MRTTTAPIMLTTARKILQTSEGQGLLFVSHRKADNNGGDLDFIFDMFYTFLQEVAEDELRLEEGI